MPRPSSIPFSTTGQTPILTPPSSSGSNQAFTHLTSPTNKFVHPARRRGSADSYLSEDDHHHHNNSARSPSYSYSLTSNRSGRRSQSPSLGSSPGACLIIRSSSAHHSPHSGSPKQSPQPVPTLDTHGRQDSVSSAGDLEFDVEPLSPFSYAPRLPSAPPSRKNSRDAYSHISPPALNVVSQKLEKYHQPPSLPPQKEDEEEHTIQLHMMPKSMLLPLPDRNAEMKHLLTHNSQLAGQIRRRLGEDRYSQAFDLWTRTRRSEVSDHEWLRRSKWFLQMDERLWNEWTMMVGWDHSVDLTKDENGEKRGVEEYADKMGHMECLEEEEE
ncbi:uncharacterized protein DFL_006686 [Arthrobotrys flagrans]|uniref:Uncharacterized protein n=1 Tax=Arthrobotrys flagrans TaxID=97331 RepID=A0A436ZTH2_ARTFL|nr:hypothetical protein DFL_006686 [Arthrobotrys flagrans]